MNKVIRLCIRLVLYLLVPFLLLGLFAQLVSHAAPLSGQSVLLLLLAVLAVVCLNWFICYVIHRKRISLLLFAYGALCLLVVIIVLYNALPLVSETKPVLADIGGFLTLMILLLASFWLAACPSRPAHAAAVILRVFFGLILVALA